MSAMSAPAVAQTATLTRDIRGGVSSGSLGFGSPLAETAVPGKAFFYDDTDLHDMWATDGTAAGTLVLRDVCLGPCGSYPAMLGTLNGVLLWGQQSNDRKPQLWRSDGTRGGTFRLLDSPLRSGPGETSYLTSTGGGFLYFIAGSSTAGPDALWRTDGTTAGTQLVLEMATGDVANALVSDSSNLFVLVQNVQEDRWKVWTADGTSREIPSLHGIRPEHLMVAFGHVFFFATSAASGYELWASDGTAAGTGPLTQFAPSSPFSELAIQVAGGRVFFVANDIVHGQELWSSDGTPAGTRRITDFATGEPFDTSVFRVAQANGRTFFFADDNLGHQGLWSTDGRPESTAFLPVPCTACDFSGPLVAVGGSRVVLRDDSSQVWSSDGTAAGTRLLSAVGPFDPEVVFPDDTPAEAGSVVFAAHGTELWRTDGSPAGTRRLATFPSNVPFDAAFFRVAEAGTATFVFTRIGNVPSIWAVTGGAARLVAVSEPDGGSANAGDFAAFRDRLAFTACDSESSSLWKSTGSAESTVSFVALDSFSVCESPIVPGSMVSAGSFLFYADNRHSGAQTLWRTDGTAAGTLQLASGLSVQSAAAFQDRLFFGAAPAAGGGTALWSSNGTPQGTAAIVSWPAKTLRDLTNTGPDLYFSLTDSATQEVWRSDGTPQGTRKVAQGLSNVLPDFTRLGDKVFFVFRPGAYYIWTSDGTTATVAPVLTADSAGLNADPSALTAFQGSLYFLALTARHKHGLWRTDGTAAGTALLIEFPETIHALTVAAGRLFFVVDDSVHGSELWESDGTAAVTRLVLDIDPGPGSSSPSQLIAAGGRLFFVAGEELHGFELWQSDGTETGTRLVQDIAPLSQSSRPDQLTVAGDRLYFTADDGATGREVWSLPLASPAGCQPASTRLCLGGGRYQVEAFWRTDQGTEGHGTAVALTADTGYFWFFSATNVEAVVKVLDGIGVNGHVWVFYGALSNVEYTLTVTDTQTGLTRRYFNPQGQLASVGDVYGFGPRGANGANPLPPIATAPPSPLALIAEQHGKAATVPCHANAQTLCLSNDRFAVTVAWKDFQGHTGNGTAAALSGDTGTFWFFNSSNVELVVKALDGRPVNNHFWLFYGALSNVEYTLTVTDTLTGTIKKYSNPSGRFASVADTLAF